MQSITKLSTNAIYAKVHAMKADLLTQADYEALSACNSMQEIGNYLKAHTAYAPCFSNLSIHQLHRSRLEILVQKSMLNRLASLCAYEKYLGQDMHRLLLLRADIDYILLCADYFESEVAGTFVRDLPAFFVKNTSLSLEKLEQARSPQDLLNALEGTPYFSLVEQVLKTPGGFRFGILENRLYDFLYHKAKDAVEKRYKGKEKAAILNVFQMRADMKILESIYRQKKYYQAELSLQNDSFFHTNVTTFTLKELQRMLDAPSVQEVLDVVRETKYGKYLSEKEEIIERKTQWIELCICQKNLNFSTSPALAMISFVGVLENEARNMTHIIEGIRYGVPQQDILDHLIQVEQ